MASPLIGEGLGALKDSAQLAGKNRRQQVPSHVTRALTQRWAKILLISGQKKS